MSNLLNFALGGLTGALSGSPLQSLVKSPVQALIGLHGTGSGDSPPSTILGAVGSRDSQIADIGGITSSVNLLQQVATALGGSDTSSSADVSQLGLSVPPATPMPAPAKPANVPTDDHGQSNIVFADSNSDSSFIS